MAGPDRHNTITTATTTTTTMTTTATINTTEQRDTDKLGPGASLGGGGLGRLKPASLSCEEDFKTPRL